MMKKSLFLIFVLLLFASFTLGIVENDVNTRVYWSFDDDNLSGVNPLDLTPNGNDGINSGPANTGVTGIINEQFDYSNDIVSIPSLDIGTSDRSFDLWFNYDAKSVGDSIFQYGVDPSTGKNYISLGFHSGFGSDLIFRIRDADGSYCYYSIGETLSSGTDYYVAMSLSGTTKKAYINGVEKTLTASGTCNNANIDVSNINNNQQLLLGAHVSTSTIYYNGKIDEFSAWNKSLSLSEVEFRYNGGNPNGGQQYPFILPIGATNFSVTALSEYNGDVINNFSVDINGSIYSTTNGTIITDLLTNSSALFNITFFDSDWYNRTYEDYNVSVNLVGELNQTDITVNFKFSNGDFADFGPINFTDLNNSIFFNVTGGQLNFSPIANIITYEVSCDNEIFAPFNYTFNFTPLMNQTFNLVVNETQNVLTFLDANSTDPINDSNVTIHFPSGFNLSLMTNESGQISFSYIQNNITEFGDYVFEVNKLGYIAINISETINSSNIPFFATYNLSRAKLTINIFDRVTGNLLSGINVSVAFIGLFNETTTTGKIIKDNLTIVGGDYLIYAGSSDYKTSIKSLTFTNQEEFTLDFYLINLSTPSFGTIFVTTTDSFFRKITGAKVELLQYVPSSLSYISVEECVTNINSECAFGVELNTQIYYIRATSIIDGEVLIAETSINGEIFTVNNDVRNLIFYTRSEFIVSVVDDLIYSITDSFISNTSSISVDFSTISGVNTEVCIEYFRLDSSGWVSVTGDTYCLESSSAVQNINTNVLLNRSNTYKSEVYIKQTNNNIVLDSFNFPNILSASEVYDDLYKSVIVMVFWVFALGLALHGRNINLWFYLAIILSWGEVILFPLFTVVMVSVFKTIISLATLFISRKKRDTT